MNSLSRNNLIDVVNSTLLNDGRVINYKEIGKQMFVSCYNLKSIVLPDSIKSIGVYSFNNCNRSLKTITIPKNTIHNLLVRNSTVITY